MDDKKEYLALLDQIIERAEYDDTELKKDMIDKNKGSEATGESWMVFHLKLLRKLMSSDEG